MDTKGIFSIVGYGLAGMMVALLTTYYFIYNPEVYENRRFLDSFNQPIAAAKDEPKKLAALQTLQERGLEWAHYQLIDAIEGQDKELIGLYIDAGMTLRNRSVIIGQMIVSPSNEWIAFIEHLGWDNAQSLSGLFEVPRHLNKLDPHFKKIQLRYAISHDVEFKNHYLEFDKTEAAWFARKNQEIQGVELMCDGDTRCIAVNVYAIQSEYEKSRPVAPTKDHLLWQSPSLSLMTAAILLGNAEIIHYLEQKGVTSRLNKMVMSDRMVVVFEVGADKAISYPKGVTVKNLSLHR
ncbi:MAG: hypothetical protein A6F72_07425 [Cycloclasticus sp. symbiont of Poecilosclerida sp. N]|nr:MAG: hypothetical protein A6F72_07425 [Cycloclasticus sp. symbiont of Poecilosclerida sp. N]